MNEQDSKAIHDLFYEFHSTDNLGLLKSKLVEYVATVRRDVQEEVFMTIGANLRRYGANIRKVDLLTRFQELYREAAANSVKDSEGEGVDDAKRR